MGHGRQGRQPLRPSRVPARRSAAVGGGSARAARWAVVPSALHAQSSLPRTSVTPAAIRSAVLGSPHLSFTDVNRFICTTPLVVAASGLAAQRITSVAWNRRVEGMVNPRASAVLRLMTSSKVVGCSTGRSAGAAPCRILST